jgi:hypothetical protein
MNIADVPAYVEKRRRIRHLQHALLGMTPGAIPRDPAPPRIYEPRPDLRRLFRAPGYGHPLLINPDPYTSHRLSIQELLLAVGDGGIRLSWIHLPPPDQVFTPAVTALVFPDGSLAHRSLSARAVTWLEATYGATSCSWDPDRPCYAGGIADVLAARPGDSSIAIECGFLEAEKILRAAEEETPVLVAPYLPVGMDLAILFEPTAGFIDRAAARMHDRWSNAVAVAAAA